MNFKSKKTIKKMWFLKKKKKWSYRFLQINSSYCIYACVCVCVKTDEPDEKESVLNVMIRRVRLKCYCFLKRKVHPEIYMSLFVTVC